MLDAFKKWPLLILGAVMVGWGVKLVGKHDPHEATALLIGVGCVILGAGLAEVLRHEPEESKRKRKDEDDGNGST